MTGGAEARILLPGPDWDAVTGRLERAGLNDVYFDHRYVALYAGPDATVEAFLYRQEGDVLLFPYLRRPVPGGGACDFETAYGYGGPVATTESPDFLAAAWRAFEAAARRLSLVAGFVRFHPLLATDRFAGGGPIAVLPDRPTVLIRLDRTPQEVWEGYADDNRRKIRKAERLGVRVEAAVGETALAAFSDLYHARMGDLAAEDRYRFGEEYFRRVAGLGAGRHRVFLARHDGETIGGALILFSRRFAHYHLSASRWDRFGSAPNNALRHAVIQALLGGPWEALHFGGGRSPDPQDTLLAFKRKFSKEQARFLIGRCVLDPGIHGELCASWRRDNPEKVARYGRNVLCYRH